MEWTYEQYEKLARFFESKQMNSYADNIRHALALATFSQDKIIIPSALNESIKKYTTLIETDAEWKKKFEIFEQR